MPSFLLAPFLLLPAALLAQAADAPAPVAPSMSLDDLLSSSIDDLMQTAVSGATRGRAVALQDAPAIVHAITRQEIEQSGARTVAEALEGVPGLYVLDDLLYVRVGVRGVFGGAETPNENLKVMIDGQRVDFRSSAISFLKHDLIAIDAVERIEVVTGPASTLYGANAVNGVINVVTRDPAHLAALGLGTEAVKLQATGTGANNKLNACASVLSTRSWQRATYLLAATWNQADRSGLQVPGVQDMIAEARYLDNSQIWPPPDGYPTPGVESIAKLGQSGTRQLQPHG
jgi:iron complex outermembrane receptor protein